MSNTGSNDDTFSLYFDGACRGNPGRGGYGGIIKTVNEPQSTVLTYNGAIDYCTNNYSEYTALLNGLKNALFYKIQSINVYGDSQLVIKQMNGDYKINSENLKPLYDECKELANQFEKITFNYIPRKQNKTADELANQGLDSCNIWH